MASAGDPLTTVAMKSSMKRMVNGEWSMVNENISVPTLLHYLEASHAYFLDFQLPYIRRELTESLNENERCPLMRSAAVSFSISVTTAMKLRKPA